MPVTDIPGAGFVMSGGFTVAARTWLTIPDGELADIDSAAREASEAVAHLHAHVDPRTRRCGHPYRTACTDLRCTLIRDPFPRT